MREGEDDLGVLFSSCDQLNCLFWGCLNICN